MPKRSTPPPDSYVDVTFDRGDVIDTIGRDEGPRTFISCSFVGALVDDVALAGSRFEGCDLTNATLADSDLSRTTWERCYGEGANFTASDLADARFEGCDLTNANFTKAEVAGSSWTDCKLLGADFSGVSGLAWTIDKTVLMYANLRGASLNERTLRDVDLTEADLTGADFERTVFEKCRLVRASWAGARFEGADLRGADLGPLETLEQIASLRGAIVSQAQAKAITHALGINVIEGAG